MYPDKSHINWDELILDMLLGLLMVILGFLMFVVPQWIYHVFIDLILVVVAAQTLLLGVRFVRQKQKIDMVMALVTFVFFCILYNHQSFPQILFQIIFGIYCLVSALASLIQLLINIYNQVKGKIFLLICTFFYMGIGIILILSREELKGLIRAFGIYLILLGFRALSDASQCVNPLTKVEWKRKVRLTFPALLCAFFPDWALNAINSLLEAGQPIEWEQKEGKVSTDLRVFVHVGPYGLQKVGHICFSYQDIVYSYGNYDRASFRFNQTIGDGVLFRAPVQDYIPNAMEVEHNTIFEYGIALSDSQKEVLEAELKALETNLERWYCLIEQERGYDHLSDYQEDYPSRLHAKTGAKLYKFKSGKFKSYWALGDNCAVFTDRMLGCLGADILSMRGIISPGTYLDWLQKEFLKRNSPVVSRTLHVRS